MRDIAERLVRRRLKRRLCFIARETPYKVGFRTPAVIAFGTVS